MSGLLIAQLIVLFGELMIEKGIPAAISVMNAWKVENPTLDDIEALRDIVKRPESYFEPVVPKSE